MGRRIHFIVAVLGMVIAINGFGDDIMIYKDGFAVPLGSHYNFDLIPAASRTAAATFTIRNNTTIPFRLTGNPRIELVDDDGSNPSVHFLKNELSLPPEIYPGNPVTFTLQYVGQETDGQVKRTLVVIRGMLGDETQVDYEFSVSCTAMTRGVVEFKKTGDAYWRAPCDAQAEILIISGGGGGGGGIRWSRGGGGGGAGERLVVNEPLRRGMIYSVTVGHGGNGGSLNNSDGGNNPSVGDVVRGGPGQTGGASRFLAADGSLDIIPRPGGGGGAASATYYSHTVTTTNGYGQTSTQTRYAWRTSSGSGGAGYNEFTPSDGRGANGQEDGAAGGRGGRNVPEIPFVSGSAVATPNTGSGGGGGTGTTWNGRGGGSGYCRIEWTGFMLP